jgi:hypothetical protein
MLVAMSLSPSHWLHGQDQPDRCSDSISRIYSNRYLVRSSVIPGKLKNKASIGTGPCYFRVLLYDALNSQNIRRLIMG